MAAIALALAYEMISGARPNQTQTLWIYVAACVAIVILTAIYTTLGGIKAVVWTDFIQASIMMGSALVALGLLYSAIPGGWHEIVERHGGFSVSDFITTGLDPAKHGWEKWKGMFEIEYTIFAGLIGSTFVTMATHGTDQDMVQRMLTAVDVRRSRRSLVLSGLADIPIVLTFLEHRFVALDLLSGASRSESAESAERNLLPFYPLSNASRSARPIDRRNFRDRDGIAQHRLERACNQFHAGLVRELHQSAIDRRTEPPCGAPGDNRIFSSHDRCRIDHFLPRDRATRSAYYSDCSRNFWLHLRLASGRLPLWNFHETTRQQHREYRCDDHRFCGCSSRKRVA